MRTVKYVRENRTFFLFWIFRRLPRSTPRFVVFGVLWCVVLQ